MYSEDPLLHRIRNWQRLAGSDHGCRTTTNHDIEVVPWKTFSFTWQAAYRRGHAAAELHAMIILGCALGLLIGAMPGLGSVNGVAILLPITFLVPPTAAIIFLAAIYYGAMYGGAISSITLGIPGASTAVATVFDGRPLAQSGNADRALTAAAVASFRRRYDLRCPVHAVRTAAGFLRAEIRTGGGVRADGPRVRDVHRSRWRRHSEDHLLHSDRPGVWHRWASISFPVSPA